MLGIGRLLRFAFVEVVQRTVSDWRLQSTAGIGVLLAVGLMASAVIYSNALAETALRHTLNNTPAIDTDLEIRMSLPLERSSFNGTSAFINQRVIGRLEPYLAPTQVLIVSDSFLLSGLPQFELPASQRPRGPVMAVTAFAENAVVLEGRFPSSVPTPGKLEVLIDTAGAELLNLSVGDQFAISPALLQAAEEQAELAVEVVGIFEPKNFEGEYWQLGVQNRLSERGSDWVNLRMYIEPRAMFDIVSPAFFGITADFSWLLFLDRDGLRAEDARVLQRQFTNAAADTFASYVPQPGWETELNPLLRRYSNLMVLARVPLFLMVSLAIGLLLYYLFLVAGFLGRARASELALYRTRGASMTQVGMVIMMEGLVIAVPAMVIGPFAAVGLVALIAAVFPANAGGIAVQDVGLSRGVFILGAGAGLVSVLVFGTSMVATARRGVIEFTRSETRPPQVPFLHRYYLDIGLLAVIGVIWWEAKSSGTFLVRAVGSDGLAIDFTLLLGPVLGVVAVGLFIFRLVPLALRFLAAAASVALPVWAAQSLRVSARNPIPVSSVLVLIVFATAVGIWAATFSASLERSQDDQVRFTAGSDFRVRHTLRADPLSESGVAPVIAEVPGVIATTVVGRLGDRALAVDPDSFEEAAWWRSDFSDKSLGELMQLLQPEEPIVTGMAIPADTERLGLWVETGRLGQVLEINARMGDSRGVLFDTVLGNTSGQGWRYLEAPVAEVAGPQQTGSDRYVPLPPYRLHTLWIGPAVRGEEMVTGTVFFDQLQAITLEGAVELASFQGVGEWGPLEDLVAPGVVVLEPSSVGRPGRQSVTVSWFGTGALMHGIRVGPAEEPVKVLASSQFLDNNNAEVGDTLTVTLPREFVRMEIVGEVDFFPTMPPSPDGFVVANYRSLLDYLLLRSPSLLTLLAEVWVKTDEGFVSGELLDEAVIGHGNKVRSLVEGPQLLDETRSDPLLTAGWAGLLGLSFVIVVLSSASGLIFFNYIDARERSEEYALLRTMGFSRLQVNGLLWSKMAIIVLFGVGIGTASGLWFSTALLPLLEVAEEGGRVVPPMILDTNWSIMVMAYAVLGGATAVTFGAVAWLIARLDIQQVLRAGRA